MLYPAELRRQIITDLKAVIHLIILSYGTKSVKKYGTRYGFLMESDMDFHTQIRFIIDIMMSCVADNDITVIFLDRFSQD